MAMMNRRGSRMKSKGKNIRDKLGLICPKLSSSWDYISKLYPTCFLKLSLVEVALGCKYEFECKLVEKYTFTGGIRGHISGSLRKEG